MDKVCNILVINPGSTSTKVAYYRNENLVSEEELDHSVDELKKYERPVEQLDMRRNALSDYMQRAGIDPEKLDLIAARGSLGQGLKAGGYAVDAPLLHAHMITTATHPALLGAILANEIVKEHPHIRAYIYDAPGLNEGDPIATVTGLPEIIDDNGGHTLNHHAVGRMAAAKLGKQYKDSRLIVLHMGGGTSCGAHAGGRIIDMCKDPFTSIRAGNVPSIPLIKLCYSGKYTAYELTRMVSSRSGLFGYLGTGDLREVESRINAGDDKAAFYFDAMAYQMAKAIGQQAAVLKGDVDAIVLTAGMAHSKLLTDKIAERVSFIAPVMVFPGAYEMLALVQGVLRIERGEEAVNEYPV